MRREAATFDFVVIVGGYSRFVEAAVILRFLKKLRNSGLFAQSSLAEHGCVSQSHGVSLF